jgi:hypothetical protein
MYLLLLVTLLQVLHPVINTISWGWFEEVGVGEGIPDIKSRVKSTEVGFGTEIKDDDPGTIETINSTIYYT